METLNLNSLFSKPIHEKLCIYGTNDCSDAETYNSMEFTTVGCNQKDLIINNRTMCSFIEDAIAAQNNQKPFLTVKSVQSDFGSKDILTFNVDKGSIIGKGTFWDSFIRHNLRNYYYMAVNDDTLISDDPKEEELLDIVDEDKEKGNWAKVYTAINTLTYGTITATLEDVAISDDDSAPTKINSGKHSLTLTPSEDVTITSVVFKGKTLKANKSGKYTLTLDADWDNLQEISITCEDNTPEPTPTGNVIIDNTELYGSKYTAVVKKETGDITIETFDEKTSEINLEYDIIYTLYISTDSTISKVTFDDSALYLKDDHYEFKMPKEGTSKLKIVFKNNS